ncbi:MAG: GtrA family protein [Candidatus Berkiellales bacterium]
MLNFTQHFHNLTFYRYVMVGAAAACVDFALFLLLRDMIDAHYLIIATMSFMVATLVNYLLCCRFVFNHTHRYSPHTKLALTYLISSVGLLIHHSCLWVAYEWLLIPLVLSKIAAMGTAFCWNFLSRKYFVFRAA